MADDIDQLFDDFKKKKQKENEANEKKAAADKATRTAVSAALQERALPVLKKVAVQITQKGHEAKVDERLENYAYPHLELTFRPVNPHQQKWGGGYTSPSKLTFISEG